MPSTPQSRGRAAVRASAQTAAHDLMVRTVKGEVLDAASKIDKAKLRALLDAADALGPIHAPALLMAAVRLAVAGA